MPTIRLALDWTPNTNHTGFYVAKAKGWYSDRGLDVTFISPHSDGYKTTPAQRLSSGEADLAVTPTETVISSATQPANSDKPRLRAIAAILQDDTSAIVTLKSSGLDRPAKLDGRTYASYGARYEGRIVQRMIRNDGGAGDYNEVALPMLGIWETILKGQADATWIFTGWEGVEASRQGVELNIFRLSDYQIPYGYTPLLVATADTVSNRADDLRAFLEASAKGWTFAAEQPGAAAELLTQLANSEAGNLPQPLDAEMVQESQIFVSPSVLDGDRKWGHMDAGRWRTFLQWLSESGLLTSKVQSRTPADDHGSGTASLDALRGGEAGDQIPRDSISLKDLFTNSLLPAQ